MHACTSFSKYFKDLIKVKKEGRIMADLMGRIMALWKDILESLYKLQGIL